MASVDSRDVERALKKKGFEKTGRKDHSEYQFPGTVVRTMVSNGENQSLGAPLIKKMATQMHLDKDQFLMFVECSLSKEHYRDHLISKKLI